MTARLSAALLVCAAFFLPCSCDTVFGNLDNPYDVRSDSYDPTTFTSLLDMVQVTGGQFTMGSTSGGSDEAPIHFVTVTSFSISRYEVTEEQYATVAGEESSPWGSISPVGNVSWFDAVRFCNTLSDLEGLEECYTVRGSAVTCDFSKSGYRLPTEAEWEFAARGGRSTHGYAYAGSNDIDAVAWYEVNSSGVPHVPGLKAPNELGLYDMSGNLWEWCWDWYGAYASANQTDPGGPGSGSYRVKRGGAYFDDAAGPRVALRSSDDPAYVGVHIGFRPVRRP